MSQEEFLPISMLNQLEYCERRFYLMHMLGRDGSQRPRVGVDAPPCAGSYLRVPVYGSPHACGDSFGC